LPCSTDAICTARRACSEAYALERGAVDALSAIRRATDADLAVPPAAADLLVAAERDLVAARDLARDCADREGELRRRYSLR
jgi:hypothetical protein